MSISARQRKLLAKRKEEQQRIWEENDANNGSTKVKQREQAKESASATAYRDARRKSLEKDEEILSCPYCGHHAKVSQMRIHSVKHPNLIIKGLYLGGVESASDKDSLKDKLKITHVLNCARELSNYFPNLFKYCHLNLKDREKQDIRSIFEEAFDFIQTAIKSRNGKCFVHCQEGKSRSVTIVAGYLMSRHGYTLDNALATISSRRRIAQPNKGFLTQLRDYEKFLQDENSQ